MRKISYLVSGLSIFMTITSCSSGSDDKEVVAEFLNSEVFIEDEQLDKPASLVAGDGVLGITNNYDCDTLFSIFDDKGKLICKTLPKGSGPGEAIFCRYPLYNSKDKSFYISDDGQNTFYRISKSPEGYISTKYLTLDYCTMDADRQLNPTGAFVKMGNGQIMVSNASNAGMWAILDSKGKFVKNIVPFPDKTKIDKELTDWANFNLYKPQICVSPDGKFAFQRNGMPICLYSSILKPTL